MKKALKFVLANIDTLVAILVSILATIFGVFGGNQILLLAGISATLAILAAGLIRDRLNREALGEQIAELKRSLPDRPSALTFFTITSNVNARFQQATLIDLCGVTLTNTINKQFPILRERIEAGAKVRILLVDPTSQAIEMSAQRSTNPKDTEYYRRRLESSFSDLTYLYKFIEDIKLDKKASKVGSLSVRLLSYAPSFGMTNIDAKKKNGIVYVEVFPHKFGFKTHPSFELTLENDQAWYDYFVEQFEQMWDTAQPWDSKSFMQKIPFES